MNRPSLEVLFTPADFGTLAHRDLSRTWCVVFDILRATSSMVTALANGAREIIPVAEIAEAVAWRQRDPAVLLGGERQGLRITAAVSGGVDFDFGNSPREFTADRVRGRSLVVTTTNGTRALRSCQGAARVLASSFLNLRATAEALRPVVPPLAIVCSGTFEEAAYEDTLAAGALCDLLWSEYDGGHVSDGALMARRLYLEASAELGAAVRSARNGQRLLARPELADDVAFCIQCDMHGFVAEMNAEGRIVRA